MRLSDAELKRDQYKTQLEKAQTDLVDAQKKVSDSTQETVLLRKQIQDLQQSNTTLSTQIEQLRNDLSRSNVAKAAADNKQ